MVETRRPVRWAGPALIVIGVLHTLVMIGSLYPVYWEMISAGLWNTVSAKTFEEAPMWSAASWSLIFGFMLVFAGLLLPKNRTPVSKAAALALVGILIVGIVVMPTGGFWFGIPVAAGLWSRG